MTPILILHGWGSCAKNWQKVKEKLEEKGRRVYLPDLPGFGESAELKKTWSIDDYLDWVQEYRKKNKLSRFFLVGHSFGGGLAVKIAAFSPENIRGLILLAPKIRRQKTFRYYFILLLAKTGRAVFHVPFLASLRPFARKILYSLVGSKDYYRLDTQKAVHMKETFNSIVKMDVASLLPRIKVPTLIVWGDKDRLTPLKDAYFANQRIAGSRLEVVRNGRHGLNLEMPEMLAEKISAFIEQ